MPVRSPSRLAPAILVAAVAIIASQCSMFAPPRYVTMATDSTGPVCVHLIDPLSDRICPVTLDTSLFFAAQEVTAETLVVHTANRVIRIPIPIRSDAIFIGQYAMSNFLLRHYDATNPARAAEVRDALRGQFRPRRP